MLDRLLELIDRTRPHALLISGDVFDRPLPPEAAVALFDRFLMETARKRDLPVLVIPGNHDSCERLGFASGLLREHGLVIFSKVEDAFEPVYIHGDDGCGSLVYGIPFVEPFMIGRALGRDQLDTPDAAIRALCRAILERKNEPHPAVLLCHALVTGGEGSESEREIFIGGASTVEASAFEGFAYTALGHLHKPQRAGADNIRYSGSLLPYSKSEVNHLKAINEVRIDHDGRIEIEAHHLKPLRRLRYIEGELLALLESGLADRERDDYMIAGLTDRGAVLDAFAKLQRIYPRLLHVSRSGDFSPEVSPALARLRERENLSELDLFSEFFQSATGDALDEGERAIVIETLAEIEREERSR